MDAYSPIRIVHPSEFLAGTAQTSGSVRLAAIAPESALNTALWGGLFEVKPRAHTGIHHHGEQQTIAYVLEGVCEVRWGGTGNMWPRRRPAISSMCLRTCLTWKSTRPKPSHFAGSSCEALQLLSW